MAATPSIATVQYAPGQLALTWDQAGASSFTIALNDLTSGTQTTYPATGFSASISVTLTVDESYTVQIASNDGGQLGPYSTAIPVLTMTPVLSVIANLITSLQIAWSAPGDYTGGYVAVLQTKGQSSESEPVDGLSWTFPLDTPLQGTGTIAGAQVQQTVSGATTTGPLNYLTVITASATMSSVDFSDGQTLYLSWTSSPDQAAYTAFLTAGQNITGQTVAGQAQCSFGNLDLGADYTTYVCVSSSDGISLGPPSTVYAVLSAAPTMTGVLTTAAGLGLAWQALAGAGGYVCYAQPADEPVLQASVSGASVSHVFTSLVPVTSGTTTWMQATAGGIVLGPLTAVYTALTGQPLWQSVANDSDRLELTWTAPPDTTGIAGYLITIEGLTPSQFPTGNTATTTTLGVALQPGAAYSIIVAATNGIVQGLPSPTLIPLTEAPSQDVLAYNGSALRLSWTAPAESGVTGYVTQLSADDAVVETLYPTASPQPFDTGFAATTVYSAQVRSSGPATLGPWSPVAIGPYLSSVSYSFDTQARLTGETWENAATISYAMDPAGNILSVTPQASTDDGAGAAQ